MVQSVCLTSRGSGVRLPQLPPPESANQSKILKSSDFGIFLFVYGWNRARWKGQSGSTGRDFPLKVWPMAFSKCRRARKPRKTVAGGQHYGAPPATVCTSFAASSYRHPNENALMPSKTELTMPRASIPARQSTSPVRVLASVLKAAIGVSFLLMNIALTTRR